MDRFKFRVWDKNTKCYKTLTESDEKTGMHTTWIGWDNTGIYQYDRNIKNDCTYATDISDDCFLEQCTGLKDKNGNLIYEGDTVRYWWNQKTNTGTICWDNYFARFCIANNKEHSSEAPHCLMFVVDKKIIEVIGNRHEPKDYK